jgi:flagellar biosynthesis GTPase FlhF
MKSLLDFKSIVEEEKSDYSKFDALVRAGLANKAQIQRIHKILDKMSEDRPQFNNADKMIIQNLFNKMVDLVSNNKQINMQARRAVKEDEDFIETDQLDEAQNPGPTPPYVLLLKRKAIRLYPDGTKIALYYNKQINKFFSVPYDTPTGTAIQAEEVEISKKPYKILFVGLQGSGKTTTIGKMARYLQKKGSWVLKKYRFYPKNSTENLIGALVADIEPSFSFIVSDTGKLVRMIDQKKYIADILLKLDAKK